jgi:two-component sensor histidine kinase
MESFDDVRARELAHRFKNILTITRSIVSQSLRTATSIEEARSVVDERLASLGGAMDLLLATDWKPALLDAVARRAIMPFDGLAERVQVEGPSIEIGASSSLTFTLVVHELMTNAIKYGALSDSAGRAELTWRVLDSDKTAELWVQWAERDGPPVRRPERQGFGTRLICTAAGRSFRGCAELDFPATGVTWSLIAPLAAVAA